MKRLLVLCALGVFILAGCSAPKAEQEQEAPTAVEKNESETGSKGETKEGERTQYIKDTFATYDFETPEPTTWIVKEEGPKKVAVIIKEQGAANQKPLISKLVFLEEGNQRTVVFVQVQNKVKFGN